MKKTTKLLSVILAFVMALSCMSMMASAAKTNYQTVAQLNTLSAYSAQGTVTRLSTEERMSILFDSLDQLLAPMSSLNMGTVINTMGLTITINLTSVNAICDSLDSFKSTMSKFLWSIAAAVVNLGIIEDLSFDNWQSGMTREGTAQLTIVNELLELLKDNSGVVNTVLTSGIDIGIVTRFVTGLGKTLDSINPLIIDLPKLINGIVLPLFSRQDDNASQRNTLGNTSSSLITVAQDFINGIFNKPMSWTSYRVSASNADLGYTTALPMNASAGTSRYFVAGTDEATGRPSLTQWDYKYAGVLGGDPAGYYETVTYVMSDTEETTGSGIYLYKAPDWYDGDRTLKWYKADDVVDSNGNIQSGYWLPSVAGKVGTDITLNINGSDSVAGLLYKWAPVIFAELAPTVLNGSLKKIIAEAFDVSFTKIGVKGDDAVAAVAAKTGNPDSFFTKAQEYYTWEYSDYKVIDGVPYYRFQDQFFGGEIPSNISLFYNMINWDYHIDGNFMDKYIPTTVGGTSAAGYTRVLEALNTFVYDLIQEFIAPSWECKGQTVTRGEVFEWTDGDNSHLIDNVLASARNLFMLAPEEIVDEYYAEAQFYDAMMNGTKSQAVNGLICALVNLLMPQIKFADNIVDQPMIAIGAAVVRELCTQLIPSYDFDAMIFQPNTYASNNRQMLTGKTSQYWLDTTLFMGVNLGMYYLRNFADFGDDDETYGYYGAMKNHGVLSSTDPNKQTFTANQQYVGGVASWLYQVDWVVDWALTKDVEWAWQFEKIIDCGSTVNLSTYQNPFNKIDTILFSKLLPAAKDLLSDANIKNAPYGSDTFLEKVLWGFVDSVATLDVPKLVSLFAVNTSGVFCSNNIADELVKIIVNLLNNICYKVAGNTNIITSISSVATLLNHNNIKTTIITLVSKLYAASANYNVLQPILPIANMFIGWTIDPQKFAEPTIYFTNEDNDTYALKGKSSNKMKFVNNSSGMLLKHRNNGGADDGPGDFKTTEDQAYIINITNITCTNGVTVSDYSGGVEPGATKDIALTIGNSGNGVSKITIKYEFTGKNGNAIGGTQTKIMYVYYTSTADQQDNWEDAVDTGDFATREAYRNIEFTQDLYGAVTEYTGAMSYKAATVQFGNRTKSFVSCGVLDTAFDARATTYFQPITDRAEAGWLTKLEKDNNNYSQSIGKLYKAKSGVTATTFNEENSVTNNFYGVWNMGQVATKYGNRSGTWHVQFVYYNDFNIGDVKDEYVGKGLMASDFPAEAATAFSTYETALMNVVKWSDYEKTTTYCTDVQSNIEAAIEALENAYDALMVFGTVSHNGDISKIEAKLDALETETDLNGNQRDINFQDYELYEYFQYEKQRTEARKIIKFTTPPEAPQKYIENGAWGTDFIDAIVASKSGATATGISATVVNPTAEEQADWVKACDEYVPAVYTVLAVDDQAEKLDYYHSFMVRRDADKTFLNREIAYAEAMDYANDGKEYSTDSWNRYVEALAKAKEVAANANAQQPDIFDAKYELMAAANALLLKSHSMKDTTYLDEEIRPLIAHAQAILEHYGVDGLYTAKIDENDALGQLVRALGISYDITVDGDSYSGILYDRSALTFDEYDRVNSVKNKRATDAAADKLRAAIENFSCNALVNPAEGKVVEVDQAIRYIQGIVPGSIGSGADLDAMIVVTNAANHDIFVSKANYYGTGARVELKDSSDRLLATYFVVIYGDVNGDGAVDAMDAIEVDLANNRLNWMGDVYDDAADVNCDGIVDATDYGMIVDCVKCAADIDQNPTAV